MTTHTDYQQAQSQQAQSQQAQSQPRRMVRPHDRRVVGGVCAGIADYTGVDVTVVRLVAVASCLFGLTGIVLYVAGLFLMPEA